MPPSLYRLTLRNCALALAVVCAAGSPSAARPDAVAPRGQIIALKRIEIESLREGAYLRVQAAREQADAARTRERARRRPARRFSAARAHRAAARAHAATARVALRTPGTHLRPSDEEVEHPVPQDAAMGVPAYRLPRAALTATPTNVRANNTSLDAADAGQAEEAVAALGSNVLVAWNDGQGFEPGNSYKDTQGYGWSTNSGASFTDGGVPPKPPGFPSWKWTSDPVVTVNEKTGKFYYCALATPDTTHNAVGLASGSFVGGSFVWDTARVVRSELNLNYLLDKPWVAADSSSGNVYVVMTTFDASIPNLPDWIDFTRSTTGGRTWSAPVQISDFLTNGLVQAPQLALGPAGKLYAAWQCIGDTINVDYLKFTQSTDLGVSFALETTPVTYYPNFGSGDPGYNREVGIQFPSLTVDRTTSATRGRVFLAWSESWDHLDQVFPTTSPRVEKEPNNTWASATSFNAGDLLRGASGSTSDADYWKVPLTAGQRLVVWVDSLVQNATYTVRLFAPSPDTLQRLCYGGDLVSNPGQLAKQTIFTFMAPKDGVYTLKLMPATASSLIGNYRIKTAIGTPSHGERGRDQRDVFESYTNDGVNWHAPVLVNDDLPGYDDYLPQIAVGADGYPYMMWRDHRDDPYGSRTHEYVVRSSDGGNLWLKSYPITSVQGNFTSAASNILPNQGDYNGTFADGRYIRAAWADGRGTSVDVWTTSVDTDFQLTACQSDTSTHAGSQIWAHWTVANLSPFWSNQYYATFTSQRNWPLPTDSILVQAASSGVFVTPKLVVPDSAKAGANQICLKLRNKRNTKTLQCCFRVTVIPGGVAVEPGGPLTFALEAPQPNPASGMVHLAFTLPAPAPVKLAIYDVRGARVRTLVDGPLAAGRHARAWDGRDDAGAPLRAGMFFCRLESQGRRITHAIARVQ